MHKKRTKIAIWGLGRDGLSVGNFLQHKNHDDLTFVSNQSADREKVKGDFYLEDEFFKHIDDFDLIIKSPGISIYRPEISSQNIQEKIVNPTEYWLKLHPHLKTIGITGTKGKSTTSSLLVHLLKKNGLKVHLGGNIGIPVFDLPIDDESIYVLEMSSYQIAKIKYFPSICVVLNLYPEHIHWHGSHQQYFEDKLHLLESLQSKRIINFKNERLCKLNEHSNINYFNHPKGIHSREDGLYMEEKKLVDKNQLLLEGQHNIDNCAAAMTIIEILGYNVTDFIAGLKSFHSLENRLEKVHNQVQRIAINDSLATATESVVEALKAYSGKNIFLIFGGLDREQDFRLLIDRLIDVPIQGIFAIGQTGKRFKSEVKDISQINAKVHLMSSLENAVCTAYKYSQANDIILLSPGAPSYDMFKDHMERGDCFKKAIQNLAERVS